MKTNTKTKDYLINEVRKVKGKVVILTLFNILFAFFAVFFALCCKKIIDGATARNKEEIIIYSCLFLGIIIIQFILKTLISYIYELTKSKLLKENRQALLNELLNKEYASINKYHSGELLNRIFSDVEIVCEGISSLIPEFMNMSTRLITALVILFVLDYKFALIFLSSGVILFFIAYLYRKKIKKAHRDVLEKEDKLRSFYQESVENNLVIKIFNNKDKIISKGENVQDDYVKSRIKRRILSIQANSGLSLVFNLFYLFALVWGAINIYNNEFVMGYGTLFALLQLVSQISGPIANLSSLIPQFYGVLASADRIVEIYKLPNEEKCEEINTKFDKLAVSNVSFGYKDNLVLKDVSFDVNKKDFIAITGLSGGGKTTLFNLLLGVYKNYKGKIVVNDQYQPGIETRNLFSYVPQGNTLFSGTIRENLTFLNDSISEEKIKKALIDSQSEFVFDLEKGIDTVIGEKGLGLSEGQAQRLALARCLIHDSDVLLLDEATSALDEVTEAKVLENVLKLEKTVIIVTHRNKALSLCNKQLILDDGYIKIKEIMKDGKRKID